MSGRESIGYYMLGTSLLVGFIILFSGGRCKGNSDSSIPLADSSFNEYPAYLPVAMDSTPVYTLPVVPVAVPQVVTPIDNIPENAYNEGYNDGYEQGLNDGESGYAAEENYDDSNDYYGYYEEKYQRGYADGYEEGYSKGKSVYGEE